MALPQQQMEIREISVYGRKEARSFFLFDTKISGITSSRRIADAVPS
jgi:hypothetical protein